MRVLLTIARERGLFVEWSRDLGVWLRGYYDAPACTITLNSLCSIEQQRYALAHELGHAWYGHTSAGDLHTDTEAERLADEHAAGLLIQPAEFAAAELLRGPHPGAIAEELGVHQDVVEVYQRVLRRRPHRILPHRAPGAIGVARTGMTA